MDIIFKRSQGVVTLGRMNFMLKAKLSLSEEEERLVHKYAFRNAVLIHTDQPHLVRQTVLVCIGAFFGAAIFFVWGIRWTGEFPRGIPVVWSMGLSLIAAVAIALIFYQKMRETIMVKDLMYGRFFSCKSVVELARKEAYLQAICEYLRQVIESAKNWGEEEKFEILPLPKEEAKARILSGPIF